MGRPQTGKDAWKLLLDGNQNFVHGTPAHPRQDADVRRAIANKQTPFAALLYLAAQTPGSPPR